MLKNNHTFKQAKANLRKILDSVPIQNHFRLHRCNDFVLPRYWSFTNRTNKDFHIAFIRSGSGAYYLKKDREAMERGKIIFISSGYNHSRKLDQEDIPRIALFRFGIYDNTVLDLVKSVFEPFAFAFIPWEISKYNELFTILVRAFKQGMSSYEEKQCGALLCTLICEIYRDISDILTDSTTEDARLIRAAEYVKNNVSRNITIDEMANQAEISRNYFRQLFKKHYGMTPKKFVIISRINRASLLLSESDCTVKQVAEMLGYVDQYTFSKQFKAIMGYPPSDTIKFRS